jgi:hypothetical protein
MREMVDAIAKSMVYSVAKRMDYTQKNLFKKNRSKIILAVLYKDFDVILSFTKTQFKQYCRLWSEGDYNGSQPTLDGRRIVFVFSLYGLKYIASVPQKTFDTRICDYSQELLHDLYNFYVDKTNDETTIVYDDIVGIYEQYVVFGATCGTSKKFIYFTSLGEDDYTIEQPYDLISSKLLKSDISLNIKICKMYPKFFAKYQNHVLYRPMVKVFGKLSKK